jgi:DNA-binding LacI/PurR family transcriptional regulator
VFLDMDGVVNSDSYFKKLEAAHPNDKGLRAYDDMIDPEAVARLNRILTTTMARVVLSSSWRHAHHHKAVEEMLRGRGFTGIIIDSTPRTVADEVRHASHRGHEIQAWLDGAAVPIDSFVILDDDADMVHLADRLVHTSYGTGLLDEHADRAIEMLGGSQ